MKAKDVEGLMFIDGDRGMQACPLEVTVRVTADERGATLSLAAEDMGMMLSVPMEPLEGLIEVAADRL